MNTDPREPLEPAHGSHVVPFGDRALLAVLGETIDVTLNVRVHALADLRERYANLGVEATSSTAAEFTAYIKAEATRFAKVLKETGVKLD